MTPKTLIIAPNWVGDMMMSQCLYRLLKAKEPCHEIHVLAPPWCLDVARRMPEVTKCLSFPGRHGKLDLKKRFAFAKSLRDENYTKAIVLPNSFKSALIPWLAKIPKRIGFRGEMRLGLLNDIRRLDKKNLPFMVQRFAFLMPNTANKKTLEEIPKPKLQHCAKDLLTTKTKYQLNETHKPILALAPSAAYGNSKCWPEDNFSQLATMYTQKGFQVWLFGAPSDKALLDRINKACGNQAKVLDKPSLKEKIDLLSLAHTLISNDSGLMHIGAALGIATIGIYGSTTPNFTPPLGEKVTILENKTLTCRPCFKRHCPKTDEDHLACLKSISPKHVAEKIEAFNT